MIGELGFPGRDHPTVDAVLERVASCTGVL